MNTLDINTVSITAYGVTTSGREFAIDCGTGYEAGAIAGCDTWAEAAYRLAAEGLAGDFHEPVVRVVVTITGDDGLDVTGEALVQS